MAQVSSILQDVQADGQVVKASQTKMETDVSHIANKLEQADAHMIDLEVANMPLSKEV